MLRHKPFIPLLFLSLVALGPLAAARDGSEPRLLPWSQQIALRETWLPKRYDLMLRIMRANGVGMWIVVNEEFHDDPLTEYVAPPRPYTGGRDIFVFLDAGEKGLRRVAITVPSAKPVIATRRNPFSPATFSFASTPGRRDCGAWLLPTSRTGRCSRYARSATI